MWQAIFVAAGGALQFFGLALAAWDIWDAGRQWRAYERRGVVIEPLPAQAFGQAFDASVATDPPPPIEERMAAVEAKVARLDERLAAAAAQQRQEREERMAMTAGALSREVRRQDEALARLFKAVLIGGWRRGVAVGSFLLGTIAATVGSLPVWG